MSLPEGYDGTKSSLHKGLRTREERDLVVGQVVRNAGIKALGVGAVLAVAQVAASRRYQWFGRLRWPLKATIAIWGSLGAFGFFAEDLMVRRDMEYSRQFSSIAVPGAPASRHSLPTAERLSWDDAKRWGIANRYELVGSAWLATALGTILYLWRKPIPVSDKLISARLYSQSLGLAGLFGFGFAATLKQDEKHARDSVTNEHYEKVLRGE